MPVRRHAALLMVASLLGAAPPAAASDKPVLGSVPLSDRACHDVDGYAGAFGGRRTFFLKPDQLMPIKAARDTDPAVKAAYAVLIARADAALARKPGSV